MAKSKQKQLDDLIEAWTALIQSRWQEFRCLAAQKYREYGRGAFIVDMSLPCTEATLFEESWPYLVYSQQYEEEDAELRLLMSGDVAYYNPERAVAFLFQDPADKTAFLVRVLAEYPNGTPILTKAARDDRWCGQQRTCPECGRAFPAWGDTGICPDCGQLFLASEEAYRASGEVEAEPIARYIPPVVAPEDFDHLHDDIRELAIRDGEEEIDPPRRMIWFALEMDDEVRNGGFRQYFDHTAGNHAAALLHLLGSSVIERAALILREACRTFSDSGPDPDFRKRAAQIDQRTDEQEQRLEQLDGEYYGLYPKVADLADELWRFWQQVCVQPIV